MSVKLDYLKHESKSVAAVTFAELVQEIQKEPVFQQQLPSARASLAAE